jgi:ubiquinone/menaquinone biosynthesis C-methylase UbiE
MLKLNYLKFVFVGFSLISAFVGASTEIPDESPGKFNTKNMSFSSEYAKLSHHQDTFNAKIIEDLSESIRKWTVPRSRGPIKILDLCCGHGKPTCGLLKALDSKGVLVEKIVGYDISEAQISTAKSSYEDPRLIFFVQNAESLEAVGEYDIVISLFGFHWIENLPQMAQLVAKSLKPGGKIMFFVPLEKIDLFEYRRNFMRRSKWSEIFGSYELHPFVDDSTVYEEGFNYYFEPETDCTFSGDRSILYTHDEFVKFLSSWLQELRYLKTKTSDADSYVSEMVGSIPTVTDGNVQKQPDGNILFTERFFSYQGTLRSLEV